MRIFLKKALLSLKSQKLSVYPNAQEVVCSNPSTASQLFHFKHDVMKKENAGQQQTNRP